MGGAQKKKNSKKQKENKKEFSLNTNELFTNFNLKIEPGTTNAIVG